jgi:hypothetical protein
MIIIFILHAASLTGRLRSWIIFEKFGGRGSCGDVWLRVRLSDVYNITRFPYYPPYEHTLSSSYFSKILKSLLIKPYLTFYTCVHSDLQSI